MQAPQTFSFALIHRRTTSTTINQSAIGMGHLKLNVSLPSNDRKTLGNLGREVKLNLSFVAKNYFYFFPERCSHEK